MVISVFSHSADLKPPAEKAAVWSKELVSSAGVLYPNATPRNSCFLAVAVLSLVMPEIWNAVPSSAAVVQRSQQRVFEDFQSLKHPVFIIYFQSSLQRASIGYFSRYLKFYRTFINHNVNGINGKTDMKIEAFVIGNAKVAFFPLPMQKKKKYCYTAFFFLIATMNPLSF